tara:strand:- start:455 stop:1660 length:1206 start_codon:yes stop_codon:yes gene_type:complete
MLSLSMIVLNEEGRLGRCLESVKGFVDEIVILDTGSTDQTVPIAKAAGAIVETIPWPGDFAPARNKALDLVKGDWVLVLDADEQIYQECIPQLNAYMSMEDVLLINLLRYEYGALMSPYSSVSRLFRRHPKIKWSRPYHSIIDDSINNILSNESSWRILDCTKPAIKHEGYKPDLLAKTDKEQRLRIAMEKWLIKFPSDPYACAKLGALEVSSGFFNKGVKLLNAGLKSIKSSKDNISEHYELLFNLAIAFSKKDPVSSIKYYRQALTLDIPPRIKIGSMLNLSALLFNQGKLDEAMRLTSQVVKQAPEVPIGWYNLGLIQRRLGYVKKAVLSYSRSIDLNPNHVESYQNLAFAMFIEGNIKGARQNFIKALALLKDQSRDEEAIELSNKIQGMIKVEDNK